MSRKAVRMPRERRFNPAIWLTRHLQVALSSLGRLSRAPVSTLMTTAVLGIAVALPAGLHVLLDNVRDLSGSWDGAATISLFLETDADDDQARSLLKKLRARPEVGEVRLIGRDDALVEFRRLSGFGEVLDLLQENPLPAVLVVTPAMNHSTPERAKALADELGGLDLVETAQLDLQWVRRMHAITEIAQRGVLVLGGMLGIAVLLIVGNTIRLEIENRRSEIEIIKLIGGTDAFIRRPFLYGGLWYGLFGGIIAWLLLAVALWLLQSPVERLAGLYQSEFGLASLGITTTLTVVLGSGLLGLVGAWLAVGRHLSAIEPD